MTEALPLPRRDPVPALLSGNRVAVLAGGPAWYGALKAAIRSARREVLLQSYLWADDASTRAFLSVAAEAARRGVQVSVIMDGFGSYSVGPRAIRPLLDAGGSVAVYNPMRITPRLWALARRNHRKMAVVDGRRAFIGGFGFRRDWELPPPAGRWDVGVRVTGPVVGQFRDLFARDWARCGKPALPDAGVTRPGPTGSERARLVPSTYGRRDIHRRIRLAIRGARERVWICNSYFIPEFLLRRAIRHAARRGLDVRLLLPTPRTSAFAFRFAGRRHYGSLLRAGVRIFEFQPSFLHAKYAVVDQRWAVVGSSNLDNWTGRFDLEADLELRSAGSVAKLGARFRADLRRSREITLVRWLRRPAWVRLLERLIGRFDPWL